MSKLSRGKGPVIQDPSPAQIVEALQQIVGSDGNFAILDTERGFIQAAEASRTGLVIEYKLAGSKTLHRNASHPLSVKEAAEAFEHFRRDDLSWISNYQWETEELSGKADDVGCLDGLMLLLLVVATFWMI